MTLRGGVLLMTTPSSMAASRFKYIPNNCLREILLSSVVMVLAFVQAALVQSLSEPYISAMHLFICFLVTNFVRKMGARPRFAKEPLLPFNVLK